MLVVLPEGIINISKASDFLDELRNNSLNNGEYPYIQIIIGEDYNHKCIMGYINQDGLTRKHDEIWIEHVCIKGITIKYESNKDEVESAFATFYDDSYWVKYQYSITIKLGSIEHTFVCEDKMVFTTNKEKNNNVKLIRRYGNHIIYLLSTIIPRINELVDKGIKEWNINFEFLDYLLKNESKEKNPFKISKDDAIRLVYRLELTNDNQNYSFTDDKLTYYVKARPRCSANMLNYYLANLVGSIINAVHIKDTKDDEVTYIWRLENPSTYLKLNPQALKDYLMRKLIMGIFFSMTKN